MTISTPSKRFTVSDIATGNNTGDDDAVPHRRVSALAWRIIFFNAFALLILIGGVFAVQYSRFSLADQQLADMKDQAAIVARALAEYTTGDPETLKLKENEAEVLMRELIAPTRLRARLYDNKGRLIISTRNLLARNIVQQNELPALGFWNETVSFLKRLYDGVMGVRPFARLEPYFEGGSNGRVYREVNAALSGEVATGQRVDEQNRLVLSVAMPIQRLKAIYGVLMVSTEGGDIDAILRQERATLIQVFLVALVVMIASSLYLAGTIAEPVRKLAAAADRVRSGHAGREQLPHIERSDEIGDLSSSLSAMTQALYDRIDAIESFAADVAHELKNPLTSLRNAVEMLERAKDDEARARMTDIIRNDVRRIDRLITDISDASRLDAELSREQRSKVDPVRLLETIVDIYKATDTARDVKFSLSLDLPPGTEVWGGDERLGHVFRNLIDNAISFSPPGGTIRIAARILYSVVRITVEDEGPGIPPDNLESIFDRFYTERPADHFGKNSGLGLFIARQVVVKAGGRVWAENRERGGAKFVVELPLAALR
jgi:two-component system sensor histidine kinase ChvG